MKRLLTAAVGAPIALAVTFLLPNAFFFLVVLVVFEWAAVEAAALTRDHTPRSARLLLVLALPPLAAGLTLIAGGSIASPAGTERLWMLLLAGPLAVGTLLVLSRTPVEQFLPGAGLLAFGLPYLAVPVACLTLLQRRDPWLLFLLYAVVWVGDAAAFYIGTRWGRHRLAPVLSPKKSWEGALAGLAVAPIVATLWSLGRLGRWEPSLVILALLTGAAAQIGDLVESTIKRAGRVKDSGSILPGHGGMYDRMDAMLLAAPTFFVGVWTLGFDAVVR